LSQYWVIQRQSLRRMNKMKPAISPDESTLVNNKDI